MALTNCHECKHRAALAMQRVAAMLAVVVVCACAGTPFQWDNARRLREGMTEQEVTALLGAPYLVKSEAGRVVWVWSYADSFAGVRTISVVFQGGRVIQAPEIPNSFR